MLMRLRRATLVLAPALLLGACGTDTPSGAAGADATASPRGSSFEQPYADAEAYPVFVNSEIVVGENRFLVGLLNDEDAPIASPDIDVHIDFYDLARSEQRPVFGTDMAFLDTGPRGLYAAEVTFERAGRWGAEVSVEGDGLSETVRSGFRVARSGRTPDLGARAPASDTPTADDVDDLREITTDPRPDPRFYRSSVAEALAASRPFVVVFATPKFCSSQFCAPTLDIVKRVAKGWPGVTFIHVEIYEDASDASKLQPVQAVRQWRLPSEPWVFVVDDRGRITAKYEGTLVASELEAALKEL